MKVNRIYKDRLFRLVFSDRRNLLELYNALNGSHYAVSYTHLGGGGRGVQPQGDKAP